MAQISIVEVVQFCIVGNTERIGVTRSTLYNWLKQHRQATNPDPVISTQADLATKNAQLKAALKRAEEERDILKKAAAYFAKQFS